VSRRALGVASVLAALGCAPALRTPRPLPAPPAAGGASAVELLTHAKACFARRPDPGAVREAESLFLAAAATDPGDVAGLAGAIEVKAWRLEHGVVDQGGREALAVSAVEAGQWCQKRAPESAACHYGLALGLGLQARERPSTTGEGLKLMVAELRRAAAGDPSQGFAGPERVLALVLLRAPSWPIGPGDLEAGLVEARKAVGRFPDYPPNQLALAEALLATGEREAGHQAARRAVALARAQPWAGDPDAPGWAREGEKLLLR